MKGLQNLNITGSMVVSGSSTNTITGTTVVTGSVLVSGSSTALNVNSGVLFVSSSGNVGVGTTNPAYKLDVNGSLNATTLIAGSGGISQFTGTTVKTYYAFKTQAENTTSGFFKITSSAGSACQIHVQLGSWNSGVGWYGSQIYHAAIMAYWGGWLGSGASLGTVSGTSGYISSVTNNGDGSLTFSTTVGNNGTGTTSYIWAYITVTTYNGGGFTFTQL